MSDFNKASAYKLDDAVNAACDAYAVEDWALVIAALDGKAPRTKAAKLLRDVRNRARQVAAVVVDHQRRLVLIEIKEQVTA